MLHFLQGLDYALAAALCSFLLPLYFVLAGSAYQVYLAPLSSFCLLPFYFFLVLPSRLKKLLHQLTALRLQHSFDHFNAMVQVIGVADMKMRFDGACFFIRRAINQQLHARLNQRSGAHRARFDG